MLSILSSIITSCPGPLEDLAGEGRRGCRYSWDLERVWKREPLKLLGWACGGRVQALACLGEAWESERCFGSMWKIGWWTKCVAIVIVDYLSFTVICSLMRLPLHSSKMFGREEKLGLIQEIVRCLILGSQMQGESVQLMAGTFTELM